MTLPYVLAFIGGNANGVVDWWTAQIMHGFARHGLNHRIVDVHDKAWRATLADILIAGNPLFCFSFQGFGMDLRIDNHNYWTLNQIPFIAYLGESPYHNPALHGAEGEGLYFLYACTDFLETYRHHMDGRAYATVLRYGYPENPHAHATRWADRPIPALFVKTGVDPAAFPREWANLPRPLRAILHDAADHVLTGVDQPVATVCADAFANRSIHVGHRRELFLFVCSSVDLYVRAVRAERMVRALMPLDAVIVGDWSHLDRTTARARFRDPIPAHLLDRAYADARITVNTSPSVRRGLHERIMAGLFAKSAILSDTTPYLRQTLAACPAFHGIDIDSETFPKAVAATIPAILANPATEAETETSLRIARELFSFEDVIQSFLDCYALETHRRTVQPWAFPPSRVPAQHETCPLHAD